MTERQETPAAQPVEAGDSARCCADCGVTIPAERLAAVPTATRCTECQQAVEDMSKWDWGMAEC